MNLHPKMDTDCESGSQKDGPSAESAERKLTLRQRNFIRHYTDPESPGFGNGTRAAELAGYSAKDGSNQLAVQGHNNLTNPNIRRAIEHILDERGCTVEHAAQRLREAMDAVQVRVFLRKNGKLAHSEPLPDFKERRQAAEFVLRLRGFLQASTEEKPAESPNLGQPEEIPEEVSADRLEFRERVRQLHPIDRSLLRALAQKHVKIIEIHKQMLIEEKWGKPYEEVEKELNQEAAKRAAEDLKAIFQSPVETVPNHQPEDAGSEEPKADQEQN